VDVPGKLPYGVDDPTHANSGPGGPLPGEPAPVPDDHPIWCDRHHCRVDVNSLAPLHVSTPTTVPLDRDGIETAVVQLIQHAPVAAWLNPVPLVVVEFHDDLDDEDDVRHVLTLPVDRARVLSAVVRSTARLVDL